MKQFFLRHFGVIGAFAFLVLITNPELIALFSVVAALGLDVFILLLVIQLRSQIDFVLVGVRVSWLRIKSKLKTYT